MKNKAATDGGEHRAHRGVRRTIAQDDDEVFVTGSTLYCRSGEEQSHKSPTPGGGPDEYRRAVESILIYLENTSGI